MKIAQSIMQAASSGTFISQERNGSGIDVIRRDTASGITERYDRTGELTRPEAKSSEEVPEEASGKASGKAAADRDSSSLFRELLGNVYTKTGNYAAASAGSSGTIRGSLDNAFDVTTFRNKLLGILYNRLFGVVSAGAAISAGTLTQTRLDAYEYEDMDFSASGEVRTEDGRSISFDLRLFLSREFARTTQISVPSVASILRDPLIVNLKSAAASISRQTFRFDLDADGVEEDVAMPAQGSAFLALDKNGDGRIGDGSELFGAMTGDGFGELREYDSDGNGWIDENDEIFSRLRVWYKNGDSEEELVDLKSADIGAIWLGEQETSFQLKDPGNNLQGMIRSTGLFLKESGGVGTIQHVDLAVGGENFVSGFGNGVTPMSEVLGLLSSKRDGSGTDAFPGQTGSAAGADQETDPSEDTKSAAERRKEAAEERERKKAEAAQRRAEKKRRSEELAEKARKKREEEEERVEQLFEERATRREEALEVHQEAAERRRAFDEEWAEKRAKKPA